jgi:hypothetical protein
MVGDFGFTNRPLKKFKENLINNPINKRMDSVKDFAKNVLNYPTKKIKDSMNTLNNVTFQGMKKIDNRSFGSRMNGYKDIYKEGFKQVFFPGKKFSMEVRDIPPVKRPPVMIPSNVNNSSFGKPILSPFHNLNNQSPVLVDPKQSLKKPSNRTFSNYTEEDYRRGVKIGEPFYDNKTGKYYSQVQILPSNRNKNLNNSNSYGDYSAF